MKVPAAEEGFDVDAEKIWSLLCDEDVSSARHHCDMVLTQTDLPAAYRMNCHTVAAALARELLAEDISVSDHHLDEATRLFKQVLDDSGVADKEELLRQCPEDTRKMLAVLGPCIIQSKMLEMDFSLPRSTTGGEGQASKPELEKLPTIDHKLRNRRTQSRSTLPSKVN